MRKSGRVRANLRGQSITPILKNFEDNLLKDAYPKIQREYITTVDGNAVNKKLKNNPLTHRLTTARVGRSRNIFIWLGRFFLGGGGMASAPLRLLNYNNIEVFIRTDLFDLKCRSDPVPESQ